MINHFKKIAKVSPLKQLIYNIPGRSIVDLSFDSFKELNKVSNIVGIKDASNDMSRPLIMRTFMKKILIICLVKMELLLVFSSSGHGCISVTANVAPKLTSMLHYHWKKKNNKEFDKVNLKLAPLSKILFAEPNPTPAKYALSLMGKCKADLREPLYELSSDTKKTSKKNNKRFKFYLIVYSKS